MTVSELEAVVQALSGEAFAALVIIIIGLWIKDGTNKIAKGLMFRLSPHYKEGDSVEIDGEHAVITKIGLFNTTFSYTRDDKTYWRIMPNDRLGYMKIEKQVR